MISFHPAWAFLGYLIVAGLISRALRATESYDGDDISVAAFWPVLLLAAAVFGPPILLFGLLSGRIRPLKSLDEWQQGRLRERELRIAREEAELKRLIGEIDP